MCLSEANAGLSLNPRFLGGRNWLYFHHAVVQSALVHRLWPGDRFCHKTCREGWRVANHPSKSALDPWGVPFPCYRRPRSHPLALGRLETALTLFFPSRLPLLSSLPHSCLIQFSSVTVTSCHCHTESLGSFYYSDTHKSRPPLAFRWLSDLVWPDSSSLPCGPFQHPAGL